MNRLLTNLLDLIFPPKCEVCRKRGGEALCPECFSRIKLLKPYLGVHAAAAYEGVLREAIKRFKFQKRRGLAEPLGILLVRYLSRTPELKFDEMEAIVPVPLHRRRQRERGFNQAELLARVVGKYFEVPVVTALERVRHTAPQFDLSREARRTNIKGAFKVVDRKAVNNRKIVLLDDIYTTGSTVAECSRVLQAAGARRVEILTLSRAVENSA